ncbi:MAG: response regulator [Spirochaetia bacterium]|nr:response regulator [Spirochaetia bacterium]
MDQILKLHKPNVLVIDEDATMQGVMTDLLGEQMSIQFAKNYAEALKFFEETDLIISETNIRDMDVIEMIKKIKHQKPNVFIVIITSRRDMHLAVEVMRHGAIDYILKPFSIDEIANLVEKYLFFAVNKQSDYDLLDIIAEESRTFILPTNIHVVSPFVYEFIEMIKRFQGISKNDIFSIRLVIYEMLINAIEHGNLELNYETKKNLLNTGINYIEYLDSLSQIAPYKDRRVEISYHYCRDNISFKIKDEGRGFDVKKFENRDIKNDLLALHGRGIIISKFNMDEMTYNESGNEVLLKKRI